MSRKRKKNVRGTVLLIAVVFILAAAAGLLVRFTRPSGGELGIGLNLERIEF